MKKAKRARLFISGRVQGVFFRSETVDKAYQFEVKGWVKNLKDGRVEVLLEGEEGKVKQLIGWLKRGPFFAKVKDLEINWEKYKGEFDNFEIKF